MTSFESSSVVGESGYFHAKSTAEHWGDGSNQEWDSTWKSFHVIDTAVDNNGHEEHEDGDNFVFSVDEGIGTLLYDGSNGDGVIVDNKFLIFLTFSIRFVWKVTDLDIIKLFVVVEGPD